jgi:hypothetical protein
MGPKGSGLPAPLDAGHAFGSRGSPMPSVFVDEQPVRVTQTMQTWADLLASIDQDLDARGRVVTDVRFDGVDEPTYRESTALRRPLARIDRIDLVTATPMELLKACLRDAAGSVRALSAESARTADLFRTQRVSDAHEGLAAVASELGQLMTLVHTLQGPLGISTAQSAPDATAQSQELSRFSGLIDALLGAQRSGDHYTIADILEYDLAPFLYAWQVRFDALAA